MKFHQQWFLPFIPNIFNYVEVTDQNISHITLGKNQFTIPINDVTPSTNISSIFGKIFGWGNITFHFKGSSYEVTNLVDAADLKRHIEYKQRTKNDSKESVSVDQRILSIPNGIVFGKKVVEIPFTSNAFERSFWLQTGMYNSKVLFRAYEWVNKGDNLIQLNLKSPMTGNPIIDFFAGEQSNKIFLRSPVSGLLLDAVHNYGPPGDCWGLRSTALLVANDEPPAEDGNYIFSDLCDFCWIHRQHIFYRHCKKDGFFGDKILKPDQKLKEVFKEQMSQMCRYVDAMPKYEEELRKAMIMHSQLRQYFKHLL